MTSHSMSHTSNYMLFLVQSHTSATTLSLHIAVFTYSKLFTRRSKVKTRPMSHTLNYIVSASALLSMLTSTLIHDPLSSYTCLVCDTYMFQEYANHQHVNLHRLHTYKYVYYSVAMLKSRGLPEIANDIL